MKMACQFIVLLAVLATTACGSSGNKTLYNLEDDFLALEGYDPVSYFEGEGGPIKGKPDQAYYWKDVLYHFANEENRKRFMENPGRYMPQYGGWCATGMSYGKKVEVAPTNYQITDGKLYLFYLRGSQNSLTSWQENEAELKQKADVAWAEMTKP